MAYFPVEVAGVVLGLVGDGINQDFPNKSDISLFISSGALRAACVEVKLSQKNLAWVVGALVEITSLSIFTILINSTS